MGSLMKTRKFVVVALVGLAAVVSSGCATRLPLFKGILRGSEEISRGPITPTGVELRAEVGAPIYQSGTRRVERNITGRLVEPVSAELEAGRAIRLPAGTTGTLMKRSADGTVALCFDKAGAGVPLMFYTGVDGLAGCLIDKDRDGRFDVAMSVRHELQFQLTTPAPYVVTATVETDRFEFGTVKREILYQGSGGGVLRLSYREFSKNDHARPAFTQELAYDFDPQGRAMIGFRGLRIMVHEAGNQVLRYTVEEQMQ